MDVTTTVQTEDDGTVVVAVSGEVDTFTGPQLRSALLEALESGPARLIIDLSAVTFLDSSGLGVLVGARRRMAEQGRRTVLVITSPTLLRLLAITALDRSFTVCATLEEARSTPSDIDT